MLARDSGLSPTVFQRDILPAITAYIEFVQLAPASEGHHHAHAGGLVAHTLETTAAAAMIRKGHLLPPGAGAEQIDSERDHWTYAVILGGLLHDLGKIVADLRISYRLARDSEEHEWHPIAGSLLDVGATSYRVTFAAKSERDYDAHRKLPVTLLHKIVPASTLSFLARKPTVLQQLTDYLSGLECAKSTSLALIVRQADQRSAARNLQSGSRARFPTANTTPLVERLQSALKSLIADGSLPLNRDGAAGWVFDGAVFFVAKRVSDEVRARVLATTDDSEGVPSRNDRLMDTWQDYLLLTPNPDTEQAIWHMRVSCSEYTHDFAMLRFPLEKLWDSSSQYPKTFIGTVEPQAKSASVESTSITPNQAEEGVDEPKPKSKSHDPKRKGMVREPKPIPQRPKSAGNDAANVPDKPNASATEYEPAAEEPPQPEPITHDSGTFLDEEDSASFEVQKSSIRSGATAVQPHVGESEGQPSPLAIKFMNWVQNGISSGDLPYNEPGAMIHFTEVGMALVSPKIFREFEASEEQSSEAKEGKVLPGTLTQRAVVKSGWHVVTAGHNNILSFDVLGRGNVRVGKLAAVVLKSPEVWVNPVPSMNPNLHLSYTKNGPKNP